MKYSPVLILGFATLILSSASAYASEPLTFDPPPATRAHSDHTPSDKTTSSRTNSPDTIFLASSKIAKQSIDQFPHQTSNSAAPKSRVLDKESSIDTVSSETEIFDRSQSYNKQSNSSSSDLFLLPDSEKNRPSPQASSSEAQDNPSPFQIPDELTDEDLFEINPEDKDKSSNHESDLESQFNSETKSENRADFGTIPSADLSKSNSISRENDNSDVIIDRTPEQSMEQTIDRSRDRNIDRDMEQTIDQKLDSQSAPSSVARVESSSSDRSTSPPASIGLNFDPPTATELESHSRLSSALPESSIADQSFAMGVNDHALDQLFKGDSNSIVAVAVGSAEGTRTPDGGKNPAYQGHTDPGNGVWNLGSFSYQHEASSPEEADAKQLARLHNQAQIILEMAAAKGMELSLEEKLNGIDLANQAPKAALDKYGSYVDWLADARTSGLSGDDAILWARVHSFLDPYTQTWDAPGLGNSKERITSDQERRMLAIAKAIATYVQDMSQNLASRPQS